jgi:hypothetical protein
MPYLKHNSNPDDFQISGISGNLYFNWCGPSGFGQVEIKTLPNGEHYIEGEMLYKEKLITLMTKLILDAKTDRDHTLDKE